MSIRNLILWSHKKIKKIKVKEIWSQNEKCNFENIEKKKKVSSLPTLRRDEQKNF